ncbi:hypothetical protein NMY22_g1119 [Coprinellus aureogranulatus]|nr:hypothetical protein NMY22_g1119 [Coprinellus aureogranulatus]
MVDTLFDFGLYVSLPAFFDTIRASRSHSTKSSDAHKPICTVLHPYARNSGDWRQRTPSPLLKPPILLLFPGLFTADECNINRQRYNTARNNCIDSLSLLSISSPSSPVPDLVIAFAGTMVIVIFGTQRSAEGSGPSNSKPINCKALTYRGVFASSRHGERKQEQITPQISQILNFVFSCPRVKVTEMASRCAAALRAFSRPLPFPGALTNLGVLAGAVRTHQVSRCSRSTFAGRRWQSTEAAASTSSSPVDPKISQIVDDISKLTLLQASELVAQLKSRLNIQEIAMPAASAAAPAAAAPASDEPAEEKPKEKTVFNVKLESFDATAKPKVIREVKALVPNLTLIDAKKFVESLPKVLKENLSKDDAEKLKKTFEAIGGVIKLE